MLAFCQGAVWLDFGAAQCAVGGDVMLPVVQQQAVRERIAGHGGLHIGHAVAVGVLQQGDVARLAYTSPLGAACSQRTLPRPLAKTEI